MRKTEVDQEGAPFGAFGSLLEVIQHTVSMPLAAALGRSLSLCRFIPNRELGVRLAKAVSFLARSKCLVSRTAEDGR